MAELIGLTPSDEQLLSRMVAEWQSGLFLRRPERQQVPRQRLYETILFVNAAGEAIPAYGVMRVTTPTTDGYTGDRVVNVAKPDATYRWRYLVNGPDIVPAGANGFGTWLWDSDRVLYDTSVSTPAFNERWGPKSGEWKLFQHRPGFILDGRFNATDGVVWAMQLPPGEVLGKADASIANAASGTVRVYGGTAGSESDTGLTLASCYNRGRYIYDEEYVRVFEEHGKHYVLPASGSTLLLGKTDASIAKDASGTVSVWTDGWGSDTTDNITATNSILSITASGKKVFVQWANGTYYIVQCECPV